jgi:hypothetical protein
VPSDEGSVLSEEPIRGLAGCYFFLTFFPEASFYLESLDTNECKAPRTRTEAGSAGQSQRKGPKALGRLAMKLRILRWPYPYRWAFGITDDTDQCNMDNFRVVYEFCLRNNIRPTKTVWTHPAKNCCGHLSQLAPNHGITLANPEYLAYCRDLQKRGIEFCVHGVSAGNSERADIFSGFEKFKEAFGHYPRLFICHSLNAENPYWGESQFRSRLARRLVRLISRKEEFYGSDPDSPFYWTDLCRQTIDYIRLYRTLELNVLKYNPMMPYHQYDKPDVRLWFSACAQDAHVCRRITPQALDRVAAEDGALIHYMHIHKLVRNGTTNGPCELKPEVEKAYALVGQRDDCWRAPVSEILDRRLVTKNILVAARRHAAIITNPSPIPLDDFQFRAPIPALYRSSGEVLQPDSHGCFHFGRLPAQSSIALFYSKEEARIGDPAGISRLEVLRMLKEEARHLIWQRWKIWRRQMD